MQSVPLIKPQVCEAVTNSGTGSQLAKFEARQKTFDLYRLVKRLERAADNTNTNRGKISMLHICCVNVA
jgi:hypothetical protein